MATLNGPRVRLRMAELNWDWETLASHSGIHERTLPNITRDPNPDPISLPRVGRLLDALNRPADLRKRGLDPLRVQDILVGAGDGTPDPPPEQPKPKPKPVRRDPKDPKAPPRSTVDERVAS